MHDAGASGEGRVTAAVLVIGDEILSGRTKDTNTHAIASFLTAHGVDLCEARVVPDVHDEIVAAVNALRTRYDYLFTTGGIGPTHDDITADAVAEAVGVGAGGGRRDHRGDDRALRRAAQRGAAAHGADAGRGRAPASTPRAARPAFASTTSSSWRACPA